MCPIPENCFIKMSQDPRLLEVDKLIRKYAAYPGKDGAPDIDLGNDEIHRLYAMYCTAKAKGLVFPTETMSLPKELQEYIDYKETREALVNYVHVWDSMLKSGYNDIRLFKV